MSKKRGYITLELIAYLSIAAVVLLTIGCLLKSITRINNTILERSELEEISIVVEDRIRNELKESIGIVHMEYTDEPIKGNYKEVSSITYDMYDKDHKKKLIRNEIVKSGTNLYIVNKGKYQIGNYVQKIFIDFDKNKKMKFLVIYEKGKNSYKSHFTIYRTNSK
ncbi:hypothetical protein [Peptostreptococcus faecalis]|uniref:hypothetical protein n=1 Tax=Peptostreptococcus faecalis TaxID=2045015 RepID=UPI000C797A33|nr:hypothetical protein [Peptostreptococcus faecalis]